MSLTSRERTIRRRLRDDFSHYSAKCLKIRTKAGEIQPLKLNQAQLYLHGRLESQKQRTGKVRALVLKGRLNGSGVVRPDASDPKVAAVILDCDLLTAAIAVDVLRGELRREHGESKSLRAWVKRATWVQLPASRPLAVTVEGETVLNPSLFARELPVADAVPPRSRGPVRINKGG